MVDGYHDCYMRGRLGAVSKFEAHGAQLNMLHGISVLGGSWVVIAGARVRSCITVLASS